MRRYALPFVTVLALLGPRSVVAQPYDVETSGHEDRAAADAACGLAVEAGLDARVVRSFRRGQGWVFTVRVEGLEERDAAAETARRLAELTGVSVQVFAVAGRDALPVEELSVQVPPSGDQAGGVAESADSIGGVDGQAARAEGERLMAALVAAHGGGAQASDGTAPELWDPVHFRFERSAQLGDDAVRVWHDYWRAGGCTRLEIRILEGEGTDSTTLVCDGRAQLLVGGALHEAGAGPSAEALDLFAPSNVLEQALGFSRWSPHRAAWRVEAPEGRDGFDWIALEQQDAQPRLIVGLDRSDGRVRQLIVRSESSELSWTYADYQEVQGGVVLPLRFESHFDGELRERVTVLALERPETTDAAMFELAPPQNP
jgi:hypothetical protein